MWRTVREGCQVGVGLGWVGLAKGRREGGKGREGKQWGLYSFEEKGRESPPTFCAVIFFSASVVYGV